MALYQLCKSVVVVVVVVVSISQSLSTYTTNVVLNSVPQEHNSPIVVIIILPIVIKQICGINSNTDSALHLQREKVLEQTTTQKWLYNGKYECEKYIMVNMNVKSISSSTSGT